MQPEASLVTDPAVLDLPYVLVEWVTMVIVTREGDRKRKLRPSHRIIITLVYCANTPPTRNSQRASRSARAPPTRMYKA